VTDDDLRRRLDAVERALTASDTAVRDLADAAAVHDRLDELEADLATLDERLDALDATVQSLHGYVGELEAVNDRVERRADAARAAVERLADDRQRPTTPDTAVHHEAAPSDDGGAAAGEADQAATHDQVAAGDSDAARPGSRDDPFDAERSRGSGENAADSLLDRVRESL
jgi:septal ring factor EnvC (AmiA/AmiB activator)